MSEPGPRPMDDIKAKFNDDSDWIWMDDRYWLGFDTLGLGSSGDPKWMASEFR